MLKIKDDVDLKELEKFRFDNVDCNLAKEELYTDCYGDYISEFDNTYSSYIGFGRRGQEYYCLIDKKTRILYIYASRPDGDGGKCELDDFIYDLIQARISRESRGLGE